MKWTPGTENDDVVDVRGSSGGRYGGGAKLGLGGIGAVIAVVVVGRLLGIDLTGLLDGGSSAPPETTERGPGQPDPDAKLIDFIKFVMKDIQDTFDNEFAKRGTPYRRAKLYIFTDSVPTRCGRSSAAIGPFYCPGDQNAYIDLSFYRALRDRFGAPGDFAQAYVLAHEMGHHLQYLLGAERDVRRLQPGASDNERSVRIELQADCYAGVWAHWAKQRDALEVDDIDEAMTAAAAIGDDRLQRDSGRAVDPESFTHGTSAQRTTWFRRGFERGDLAACDSLSGAY